jgi:hypothetical protein
VPDDWLVSRVCEEFTCLPMQAAQELERDPEHRALAILELRAYARAKAALDRAEKMGDVPMTPMVEWVMKVAAEKIRLRREATDG